VELSCHSVVVGSLGRACDVSQLLGWRLSVGRACFNYQHLASLTKMTRMPAYTLMGDHDGCNAFEVV